MSQPSQPSQSSHLMLLIPWPCFDVYALRTSKRKFIVLLTRLGAQYGPCKATESIPAVIHAFILTMSDVEEAWEVWRDIHVRATLQSGFAYTRSRIRAACWRRHQGRPPASFVGYQSLYNPVRYTGTPNTNQPCAWQGGPLTQADEVSTDYYGNTGNHTAIAQVSDAQRSQFTPVPQHVSQQYPALPQSASGAVDYPPPSYPPPGRVKSQRQQSLVPNVNATLAARSPPSPAVIAAVEVATRFCEAVNKAVNICIELNEM